jgi:hypothetical protein
MTSAALNSGEGQQAQVSRGVALGARRQVAAGAAAGVAEAHGHDGDLRSVGEGGLVQALPGAQG